MTQPDPRSGALRTAAFAAFIAPAARYPQIWRLLLGVVLMSAVYVGWLMATALLVRLLTGPIAGTLLWQMAGGSTPTSMLLLFSTFFGLALGPVIAARILHKRGLRSLIGRPARVLRDFVLALATVAAVYAVSGLIWSGPFDATQNLPLGTWLGILPLALLGLGLQTLAEELAFRGYLMQQLAVRFRSPVIWIGLPTLAFALLHYDPAATGGNAWYVVAAISVFGVVSADLTRRTGSLGASWGFHFGNNFVAVLILATGAPLSGLSLYHTPYGADDPTLPVSIIFDLVSMLVTWAILVRLTTRYTARSGAG